MSRYQSPWGRVADAAPQLDHRMSERFYIALIGLCILLNLVAILLFAAPIGHLASGGYVWLVPVAGVLAVIGGVEITVRTPDWRGSAAGLLMNSVGMAALFAPWASHEHGSLWQFIAMTVISVAVLVGCGLLRPRLLYGIGAFMVAMPTQAVIVIAWSVANHAGIWAALAALGFSAAFLAFLDRYFTRALNLSRNADNAVDTACAVYLESINTILKLIERR